VRIPLTREIRPHRGRQTGGLNLHPATLGIAVLALLAVVGLAGCASLKPGTTERPVPTSDSRELAWSARQEAITALEGFRLSGRAALQSERAGWTARLDWQQGPQIWTMELSGPFNQGTVRLAGDDSGVSLESDGERIVALSIQALLGDNLGWRVPLESLRFWVLGLPAPQWPVEDLQLDAAGRLTDVRQGPWRLSVLAYMDDTPLALPRRVYVNGEAADLRLVVRSWGTAP